MFGLSDNDEYSGPERRECERKDTRELNAGLFSRMVLHRHDQEIQETVKGGTSITRYYQEGREIGVKIMRGGKIIKLIQVLASPFAGSREPTFSGTVGGK